ncbi:MAG: (deoxy)nucleoside triphosphate pyrophosphohydrolase [Nanoarchaeota archaeon]
MTNNPINLNNKTKIVSGGIIKKGNHFLIAKRKPDCRLEANKWEFPGGKVEFSEDPKDTLKRELKEELNIEIKINSLFDVVSKVYCTDGIKTHVIMIFYLVDYLNGEIKALDCQDFALVKKEDLQNYDFALIDKEILEKLL